MAQICFRSVNTTLGQYLERCGDANAPKSRAVRGSVNHRGRHANKQGRHQYGGNKMSFSVMHYDFKIFLLTYVDYGRRLRPVCPYLLLNRSSNYHDHGYKLLEMLLSCIIHLGPLLLHLANYSTSWLSSV